MGAPTIWALNANVVNIEYRGKPRISAGRINTRDTPTVGLDNSFSRYEVGDEPFRAFVMFRPRTAGSIWVPIVSLPWSWGGTAQNNGSGNWSLAAGSGQWSPMTSPPTLPFVNGQLFTDVTLFPTWTQFANALSYGPCP